MRDRGSHSSNGLPSQCTRKDLGLKKRRQPPPIFIWSCMPPPVGAWEARELNDLGPLIPTLIRKMGYVISIKVPSLASAKLRAQGWKINILYEHFLSVPLTNYIKCIYISNSVKSAQIYLSNLEYTSHTGSTHLLVLK